MGFNSNYKSTEEQYERVSDIIKLGYWFGDINEKKMFWASNLYRLLGYQNNEVEASENLFLKHIHPEDRKKYLSEIERATKNKNSYHIEFRYITKQNTIHWGISHINPVFDNENSIIGFDGILQNIDEKKQLEFSLKESEEKYKSIVRNFPNGAVLIYDKNLRYVLADGKGLAEAGLKKENIEGKTIWEVFPEEICKKIEPAYQEALNGTYNTLEVEFGNKIYITHHIPIEEFNTTHGVVMTQDITQSTKLLQKLKESEEVFKTIFKENKLVSLLINPETGAIIDANKAAVSYYGYSMDELIRLKIMDINISTAKEVKEEMGRAREKKKNFFNFKHRLKNGEIRHVEVSSTPLTAKGEKLLFSIIVDVDERTKASQEINKLITAIEQSPTLISITDKQGRIEYANKKFEQITGYSFEEIKGQTHRFLQYNKANEDLYSKLWKTILSGKVWEGEFTNQTKNGKIYYEKAIIAPVLDKTQKIVNFIAIKEDITLLKKAQQALKESEEKYRKLVESAPVGIGIMKKSHIVFANKYLLNIFGYENLKDFLKIPVDNHIFEEDLVYFKKLMLKLNQNEIIAPVQTNYRIVRKDGKVRYLNATVTELYLNNEKHLQGIVIDKTKFFKIEQSHKRLVADSVYINQKNALISHMAESIENLFKKYQISAADKKDLSELIRGFTSTDKEWEELKQHFEIIHNDFFAKLKKLCPKLTQNEIRHCAYIKMNFSTKEIARLFNVKDTTIQVARYRLKKKLRLNQEDSLIFFIQSL